MTMLPLIGLRRIGVRTFHGCQALRSDELRKKFAEMGIDPKVLDDAERILEGPAPLTEAEVIQKEAKDEMLGRTAKSKKEGNDAMDMSRKAPQGWRQMNLPEWKRHKYSMYDKFQGERWNPGKKISREQMATVRMLKQSLPHLTASDIAKEFRVSPEAVSKILKSKWKPMNDEEEHRVMARWKKRRARAEEILGAEKNKQRKILIKGDGTVERTSKEFLVKNANIKQGRQKGDLNRLFLKDVTIKYKPEF